MIITTSHPASCFGKPIITDESGKLYSYPDGLREVLKELGWSRIQFAYASNLSIRTIEEWFSKSKGMVPSTAALNVLADALEVAYEHMD